MSGTTAAGTISVGGKVRVQGLTSRPELNGQQGAVASFDNDTQRWAVRLDNPPPGAKPVICVRRENLTMDSVVDSLARSVEAVHVTAPAADSGDSPVTLIVSGERLTTTKRALLAVPGCYFEAMLRQRDHFAAETDGALTMEGSAEHYEIILRFLEGFASSQPLDSDFYRQRIAHRDVDALCETADFLLLPPLVWLLKARKINQRLLAPSDGMHREKEDVLRWLYSKQRDHPALCDLHLGLIDVHGGDHLARTLRGSGGKKMAVQGANAYPMIFDELYPRGLATSLVTQSTEQFSARFEEFHPGLLAKLHEVPCTAESGWFVAGGSVLRTLMTDKRAGRLFASSDVDIFLYVRSGDGDGTARATELAHAIAKALYVKEDDTQEAEGSSSRRPHWYPRDTEHITRTLWTLNLETTTKQGRSLSVQIILRVYQSPSEVLCGFDIDACCAGFGADGRVWALPRALTALLSGRTVLNPLHAWPRQPSYELRLAKYAARGFVVCCPGLFAPPKPNDTLQWKILTRRRLIELRGAARLLHMDMALGLPENKGYSNTRGPSDGYRGPDFAPANWDSAIRRTFESREYLTTLGSNDQRLGVFELPLTTLPTDFDQVREIIEDPYGWIENYYDYKHVDSGRLKGDALLKLYRVDVKNQTRPAASRFEEPEYVGPPTEALFEEAWAKVLDAGHDKLAIPRRLRWSTLPRSREYMNMEETYSHLWRAYQRPIFRVAAALEEPTQPEYGESFMEEYRARSHGGTSRDDDDDDDDDDDEEEWGSEGDDEW